MAIDKEWTKEEQMLFKQPVMMLATAVIKQWQLDGCPACDAEAIEYWRGILRGFREIYKED